MSRIESPTEVEPWIGLVHVRPMPGTNPMGDGVEGAYVQIVALARNAENFEKTVRDNLLLDDLILVEAEDVATVRSYRKAGRINTDLNDLACSLSSDNPIGYDIFAPYVDNDS